MEHKFHKMRRHADTELEIAQRSHFHFKVARPMDPAHPVDWSKASFVQRSGGGCSSGVFFVEFAAEVGTPSFDIIRSESGVIAPLAVLVKPDDDTIADVMGTRLADLFGIKTPRLRVLEKESPEGASLYAALVAIDEGRPAIARCKIPVRQALDFPLLLVQEFARGRTLAAYMQGTEGEQLKRLQDLEAGRPMEAVRHCSCQHSRPQLTVVSPAGAVGHAVLRDGLRAAGHTLDGRPAAAARDRPAAGVRYACVTHYQSFFVFTLRHQ